MSRHDVPRDASEAPQAAGKKRYRNGPVRLLRAALTGRVYAVTDYTLEVTSEGQIRYLGHKKHDVTDDFNQLVAEKPRG